MNDPAPDIANCDKEPIHIPGSIQPHGLLLVVDLETGKVTHAAGDPETWLCRSDWRGQKLGSLIDTDAAAAAMEFGSLEQPGTRRLLISSGSRSLDAIIYRSGRHLVVELEAVTQAANPLGLLPRLEAAAAAFERATTAQELWAVAASEFRDLTGFDHVMVYRFSDDDSGVVVGEDAAPERRSFFNHHFPASDIPKQARALYLRNLVRVIPDVAYRPRPLVPDWDEPDPLDMSDSVLRSVSPIHLRYLMNMGVAASASISIVKDGALWGLIACHNATPRTMSADVRAASRALGAALSRQIKAREETDVYRQRVRLRTFEDDLVELLSREGPLDEVISNHIDAIMRTLGGDGVAVLRGTDLLTGGRCPSDPELRKLAAWVTSRSADTVFATHHLGGAYTMPEKDAALAAGLLAITISVTEPWLVLWFRSEEIEVVNWAGNPHKRVTGGVGGTLMPRASFDAWAETVRNQSRPWSVPEIEAANRLRLAMSGVWQNRRIRELNRQLMYTLQEKDTLLQQKDFLMGEVNHRVQNSLQLVSSFLALQARASDDAALQGAIEEARRRISAVALVHRRLYRADQLEAIDVARYLDEVLDDLLASMDAEWNVQLARDLEPAMLPTDRAVGLGLIVTELIINANKYAYGGSSGPLRVMLRQEGSRVRLIVADKGVGRSSARKGFGSRMMDALVAQFHGTLVYEDEQPGTRAMLTLEHAPASR